CRIALLGYMIVCAAAGTLAQSSPTATASPAAVRSLTPVPPDFNTTFLQFETALQQEAKEHREFLRDSLDQLKLFISAIVVLGGIIFTWLNIKTSRDVRAQINARFQRTVDSMLDDRIAQFNTAVENAKKKVEDNAKNLEKLRDEQLSLND